MKCNKYKEKVILHLYGELNEEERVELESHIKECPVCSKDLAYTKEIFRALDERGKEEIPEANWEKLWKAIDSRIHETPSKKKSFALLPRWTYATASLLLVFALGIFIGRLLFFPSQEPSIQPALSQDSLQPTLQEHFEDLKPVLIEYANYPPSKKEKDPILMDKDIVRNLLIQNMLLRSIIAKRDPSLVPFLEDLDLVLREIANHKKEDKRTPSLIKDLIHQRDILFRMEILQKI